MNSSIKISLLKLRYIFKLIPTVTIICIVAHTYSQAKLLKVTATGTIKAIFGYADTSVAPFDYGEPFSYKVVINDDSYLDTHPSPNYTSHSYTPNFLEDVAGAASVTFGTYTIQANQVELTHLGVSNDYFLDYFNEYWDEIEIISLTKGIAAKSFSLHQRDRTGGALSSAIVTPELFLNNGFMDLEYNNVYIFMDHVVGACGSRKCAVGSIKSINVTPIDICGDGNLNLSKKYEIPIPATTNLDCGRVVWAQEANSGERLEIIWQCSPNGDYYDFVYKGPGGNPQGQVGRCHFNHGANVAYYIAPETQWSMSSDKPDHFIIAAWMSLDGYEDDQSNGYLDVYKHYYDACNDKYSREYHLYEYAQGCNPISEQGTFTTLKSGCENWHNWPQHSDSPWKIDPPLGSETEALFKEILTELDDFPHNGQSFMGNLTTLLCDIDIDGDCDKEDKEAAKALVGVCSGEDNFYLFADLDGDSCITDFDLSLLFLVVDGDSDGDGGGGGGGCYIEIFGD